MAVLALTNPPKAKPPIARRFRLSERHDLNVRPPLTESLCLLPQALTGRELYAFATIDISIGTLF